MGASGSSLVVGATGPSSTAAAALRARCVYGCASGGPPGCASGEGLEAWLTKEVHQAIEAQDAAKLQELASMAPMVKEQVFTFPGEEYPMTALALALQRRDQRAARALLEAGASPNLPISEEQRSVYAHRSQLAALNGGDPDLQNLVPSTHFESLCAMQHKELFMLLLDKSANPNSGIIQVCHCGDLEMLEALLGRGCEPNAWSRGSTPIMTAVKSKIQPYEKVVSLLRVSADPNFMGSASSSSSSSSRASQTAYPALTTATRKRDYRMVRILLDAGADVNQVAGDEGLPNALFWATYWGELEMVKLFVTLSKHRLNLGLRKYTNETVFDVARTSQSFATMKKPRHIAKLPLPSRPPAVYERIEELLEEYKAQYPEACGDDAANGGRNRNGTDGAAADALTGSTTAATRYGGSQAPSGGGGGGGGSGTSLGP